MTSSVLQRSLFLPLLLAVGVACSSPHAVSGASSDAGDDAGDDAGLTDGGPDAGCNPLDPACPCPENFHRCGTTAGRCHFNQDPDFCGDTCVQCPSDQYTDAVCDGTQCQVTCKAGSHKCGDHCVPVDGNSCGDACVQCPTAINGAAFCDAQQQCAISCGDGFATCGDGRCGAAANGGCSADGDCCSGTCGTTGGSAGHCCAVPGTPCQNMGDCNGCFGGNPYQCNLTTHACCIPAGLTPCHSGSDCCSGICGLGNLCQGN